MLKLKVPPAVVFFICIGLMWVLDRQIPDWFVIDLGEWVPKIILGIGIFFGLGGIIQFMKNKTSVDPHHPEKASMLVTSGVYNFSRNPMYLAMFLILLGGLLKFGEPAGLIVLIFYVWYMNEFQIKPEEEVMTQKFGEEFMKYKSKVRRWL
ncbi:methyltransferase family protein [Gracilimonas sp.]|uniref:methyltransferase family protein n=1 Tax=Gracilimonas sp. TaxID=1974203 RepID=UPI00287198A6|nr:isoprenylcysteine carboxylmethyltransferase family protein [Gracilimonas sp.]